MRRIGLSWALAGAAALVISGLAGGARAQTVRVALLPVVVNSNSGDTEYLASGLADMLSARLEQSGEIAIVRLDEGTTDRDAAIGAAKKANAAFAVYGSYTQFGDGASLDLRCASVAMDDESPRRVFIQAGTPSEIIPQLEELSQRVARYMIGASVAAAPPAGTDAPRAAAAGAASADVASSRELRDLEARVDAIEAVIFNRPPDDTTTPN